VHRILAALALVLGAGLAASTASADSCAAPQRLVAVSPDGWIGS